jgi:hypothetical protein
MYRPWLFISVHAYGLIDIQYSGVGASVDLCVLLNSLEHFSCSFTPDWIACRSPQEIHGVDGL